MHRKNPVTNDTATSDADVQALATDPRAWMRAEIRDIRRRVQAVPGLSVNQVLRRSGVAWSTWWRWEQYVAGYPDGQVATLPSVMALRSAMADFERPAMAERPA